MDNPSSPTAAIVRSRRCPIASTPLELYHTDFAYNRRKTSPT